MQQQISYKQQHLMRLSQNLQHLNPQAVLTRGYALVQDAQGDIINSSSQLQTGDTVKLTLGSGAADAIISRIHKA